MKKRTVFFIFALAVLLGTQAQDQTQFYQKANEAYEMGRFSEVDSILSGNIRIMKGDNLVKSYRLLALSSLIQDRSAQAEEYAAKLLEADPYYTAYDDSPRFSDILERLKKGKTTVTTASKLAESVEEVPVPVTLITQDMIRASGARSLTDLMLLYVPGISQLFSIEENVAMRGIYGTGQETILIMVDGHRLNSPSTNAHPFDFRNDIEKIKQIEVLRGPASSLYGNVALTAVVNIITKSGSEVDGGEATFRTGSNNTFGGSLLFGNGNLKTDYLVWASLYSSRGQKETVAETTHYIGGYNSKPSYELGAKIRWGDFKVSVIGQHGKTVPYYNILQLGKAFSYDSYAKQRGERPGMGRTNMRVDLDYSHSWGNFSLSASAFAASERTQFYNVMGDTIPFQIISVLANMLHLNTKTRGVWQGFSWEDYSFGGSVNGSYSYKLKPTMPGSVLVGFQYENFLLSDAVLNMGADFINTNTTVNTIFLDGMEHTISSFFQLKQNFTKKFIFNGGLRYDRKIRNDKRKLNTFSPRVSFIYLASPMLSYKIGYSHSFVDAPLYYRASTIPLFSGGTNLNPEQMESVQAGANINFAPLHLKYEINTFFNSVRSIVYYSGSSMGSSSGNSTCTFSNSGKINMCGIENVLQYNTENTLINLNCTYQYPLKIVNFSSTEHNLTNVPRFLLNIIAAQKILQRKHWGDFWARANMHLQSSVECLNNDPITQISNPNCGLIRDHQDGYACFGAGVEWESKFGLKASLDAYNLFDKRYYYGGELLERIPAQGFSLMGKLTYSF